MTISPKNSELLIDQLLGHRSQGKGAHVRVHSFESSEFFIERLGGWRRFPRLKRDGG
jgi:hypothetical protein